MGDSRQVRGGGGTQVTNPNRARFITCEDMACVGQWKVQLVKIRLLQCCQHLIWTTIVKAVACTSVQDTSS